MRVIEPLLEGLHQALEEPLGQLPLTKDQATKQRVQVA